MSKWVVRNARESDTPWLLKQCSHFIDFLDFDIPVDVPHLLKLIDHFIREELVLVVEKDGELAGVIAATVQPHFLNPNVVAATEVMWWVEEKYRGTRAGAVLLDAYDKVASEKANLVVLSVEAHSAINPQTLAKRGWKQQEMSYVKRGG